MPDVNTEDPNVRAWILWNDEGTCADEEGKPLDELTKEEAQEWVKKMHKDGHEDVYAENSETGEAIEE